MFPHFSKKRPNSRSELKRAYRELAKEFHPDVEGGSSTEFQQLQTELEQIREILDSGKSVDWTGAGNRVDLSGLDDLEWHAEPEFDQWIRARMSPTPIPSRLVRWNGASRGAACHC
jgi:curved DNA-binding protein CbpA